MKHATTHNILLALLASILSVLSVGSVSAQQSTLEPLPEPAEIIIVKAQLARLSIAVTSATKPVPKQLRWEVRHGARTITQLVVDAPDEHNPLSLVLLLDLAEQRDGACYSCLRDQLEALPARLHLKSVPRIVVAAPAAARLPVKWPQAWSATYTDSTSAAFNVALDAVEHSPGTRRALLVVTNRVEQLPLHSFEDADARLVESAAFIYLMTVKPPKVRPGAIGPVIARSNLSTLESFAVPVSVDYLAVQFKHFARLANALFVISYPLPATDTPAGAPNSAEVRALAGDTGRVFLTQTRTFNVN